MKKISPFLFFLLTAICSQAQSGYEIKVTLKPFQNQYIYLGHYNGKQLPVVDSVKVNEKSEGIFRGSKKLGGGIYLIAWPDKSHIIEFLLDSNQRFSIFADTADVKNVHFVNSPENVAFRKYQHRMAEIGKEMDDLMGQLKDAKTEKVSTSLRNKIEKLNTDLKTYRTGLMNDEKNGMLATLLKWMREPEVPKDDPAAATDSLFAYHYFKKHYWDDVHFYDDRLSRTPFFENKVDKYFEQLVYPSPDSVIKEIDWMMGWAGANPEMEKVMLLKFINRYYTQKYMWEDKVYVHLFERYIAPTTYSWMSESGRKMITDRAYSLMSNIMGNPAPDISLPDTTGTTRRLYDVRAPYVLVTIWDPLCGHCKETLPKIDSMYQAKWKAEGVKVFALAKETDGKKDDWFSFINKNNLHDWVHVYSSKDSEAERVKANIPSYSQLYDVQSFPTLYLLDKDKRIIAKKLSFQQVDEILDLRLKADAIK